MFVKPIPVKPYRTRAMGAYILNAMKQSGAEVKADFEATTSTWKHKVTFSAKPMYKGSDAKLVVRTDDYVWNLLDNGTLNRYSRPSADFSPKSVPRFIGALPGSGKMIKSRKPYKGIDAREWTITVFKKRIDAFNQRVVAAIYKGFNW